MKLAFFDDHQINELQIYLYEIAGWRYVFIELKPAHDFLSDCSTEFIVASFASFANKRDFLAELTIS